MLAAVPEHHRETAIAYLDEKPYAKGEPMPIDGHRVPAPEELHLGFIDCEADRNWAHACLYVRCGTERAQVDPGSLPPPLKEANREMTVLQIGSRVPSWAIKTTT